jgi:hypothetical protein
MRNIQYGDTRGGCFESWRKPSKQAIEAYEKKNYINYYKRDFRTMAIAQKRVKIDNPNPDLVYYEVNSLV